ncbi:MAG TPA: hypothetical protein EYP20_01060 [Aigarchaeota archaeon]|nr:hypothetical protein [Aigarchaeota archaeon]
MEVINVFRVLLKKEVREALSNRWLLLYVLLFAGLGVGFAYYSSMGLSTLGFRIFGRVSAAIVNMNLYLIPLLAMFLTGLSIVGEREKGTVEFLLAQPVSKTEVLISKYLGALTSITIATTLGYGITAWYLWFFLSASDLAVFLQIIGESILLAAVLSAVGTAVGTMSKSRFQALAIILTLWFSMLIIFDLALMAFVMLANPDAPTLFTLMTLNPAEASRLLMIYSIDPTLLLLGPISVYVARSIGGSLPLLLLATQAAWITTLLTISTIVFRKQDM